MPKSVVRTACEANNIACWLLKKKEVTLKENFVNYYSCKQKSISCQSQKIKIPHCTVSVPSISLNFCLSLFVKVFLLLKPLKVTVYFTQLVLRHLSSHFILKVLFLEVILSEKPVIRNLRKSEFLAIDVQHGELPYGQLALILLQTQDIKPQLSVMNHNC